MFTKRTVFPTAVNLYHCLRELSFLIRTIFTCKTTSSSFYMYFISIACPSSGATTNLPMCPTVRFEPNKNWHHWHGSCELWVVTPWKINGWNIQITHLERKMIWTKPLWLCSMLIFQGVHKPQKLSRKHWHPGNIQKLHDNFRLQYAEQINFQRWLINDINRISGTTAFVSIHPNNILVELSTISFHQAGKTAKQKSWGFGIIMDSLPIKLPQNSVG